MNPALEAFIVLHDIDTMLNELNDPRYKKLGMMINTERVEELGKARDGVAAKLDTKLLKTYERLRKRYGRGVAPIIGGVCLNCFVTLPTGMVGHGKKNEKVESCPNCGVYIYWG